MLFQFLLTGFLFFLAFLVSYKLIIKPLILDKPKTSSERAVELQMRIKELELKKQELNVSKQLLDVKSVENELDEKQKELDNLLKDV